MSKCKVTTDIIVSRFIDAHTSYYNYDKVIYTGWEGKVIIGCPTHGEFLIRPAHFISGKGCPSCGFIDMGTNKTKSKSKLIKGFQTVHGTTYSYNEVDYTHSNTKVTIVCNRHGKFTQSPASHLQGHGCPSCMKDKASVWAWTKSSFIEASRNKGIDNHCTLYVIKCTKESEEFYKIGMTINSTNYRYKSGMPYQYSIVAEVTGEAGYIYDLEKELHRSNKVRKYQPIIKFGGYTECYTSVDLSLLQE